MNFSFNFESKSKLLSLNSISSYPHSNPPPLCYYRRDPLSSIISLSPFLVLPFSPFISFIYALFIMIILSPILNTQNRVILSVCVILSGSFLNGDAVLHSDFEHYYRVYNALLDNNLKFLLYFGSGIELALPTTYLILGKFFGKLSPTHFMNMQIIFTVSLFYIWLEVYGIKNIANRQKAICVAMALMFFDFWCSAWLVRQILASVFILYTISARSNYSFWIFFITAILFHTTSIIFIPLILLLYKYPKTGLFFCVCISISFIYFLEIANYLYSIKSNIIFPIQPKLYDYVISKTTLDGSYIGVKNLILLSILTIFSLIYLNRAFRRYRAVILGLEILYISSIYVSGHFSLRVGVFLIFVSIGYFLFLSLRKQPFILLIFALFSLLNIAQTKSVFGDLSNTRIFANYDIYGNFFYYLN
ncbi:EpsG family protein [Helicobacter sp. MIT 14-3879]|uniref:EpsG family protein n=1 Tax=Helicobacter sp. MIT 14-3879 TaxID=2040649 RepID=UPI000E1F1BA2|nr:EpsG family protein [Helicobacter sp. MIT 14-3879]RDU62621.1 hypothetical protein CQA44_06450 [Helicobacter sp. MIT 14-3879]